MRTGAVGLQLADEFAAVISLPGEIAEDHPTALQVNLHALGKQRAGRSRSSGSKGQELQAAADVARGVLDLREVMRLHLRPVVNDIIEVLGIGGDLLEHGPALFT